MVAPINTFPFLLDRRESCTVNSPVTLIVIFKLNYILTLFSLPSKEFLPSVRRLFSLSAEDRKEKKGREEGARKIKGEGEEAKGS
jgi:hypothetical protein